MATALRRKEGPARAAARSGRPRPQRRQNPLVSLTLALLLFAGALVPLYYGLQIYEEGRVRLTEKQAEAAELELRLKGIEQVNDELRRELLRLQNDDYLEILARQRLGLVRPGEIPYMTIDAERSGGETP